MQYHLLCEVGADGSTQIFVRELPGCYSRARTLDEAVAKAPGKIREFLDWLKAHGEPVEGTQYEIQVEAAEVVRGDWPVKLGDSQALFNADLSPLSRAEVERAMRYMRYAREDLMSLYQTAPGGALEWKPNESTPRHIKRIAEHIAEVDIFYLERLRDMKFKDWPSSFLELMEELRVLRLSNLKDDEMQCQTSYHPPGDWTGTSAPEGWTTRKVLRRFIWHERLHTATIRKLLSQFNESEAKRT